MLKKAWRKPGALLLVLALLLSICALAPKTALAAPGRTTIEVDKLNPNGEIFDNWVYGADTLLIKADGITLTGTNAALQVFVFAPATQITLNGAEISMLRKEDGDLAVTLVDSTTSSLSGHHTGIHVLVGQLTLNGGGVFNISGNEQGINARLGITITGNTTVDVVAISADAALGTAVQTGGGTLMVGAGSSLAAKGGNNTNGQRKGGLGIVALSIINDGTITAEGGNGDTTDGGTGLFSSRGITNTGTITATGGNSNTGAGGNGIYTDGNITNSGTLNATGGTGTPNGQPIIINRSNITVIDVSASGPDFTMDFTTQTLTDPTGVVVNGDGIAKFSRLIVQPNKLHAEGNCKACDAIRGRTPLAVYDISLNNGHSGSVDVFIPLSGSGGGSYTVLHCNKGVLEEQAATYANGGVTTTWKKLSPFAVVQGVNVSVPENTVVDPPKTGDASGYGMVGVALVLVALGLCAVMRKKRRSTNC